MRKMTCDKGHFYDGDAHEACPICQKVMKDFTGERQAAVPADSGKRDRNSVSKKKWLEKLIRPEKHTLEMSDEECAAAPEPVPTPAPAEPVRRQEEAGVHTIPLQEIEERETLASQVAHAQQESAAGNKTMAFYGTEAEPVTGWLVCVRGAEKGMSYPLKTGQNFIGRALNMDIALHKEQSVSRNKHAVIIFEPKKQIFFIQQGESSGLTYVNDELLMGMGQLKAYDQLQLGECELIFVPFCGPQFNWKEYL